MKIIHKEVGNGNCCVVEANNFVMVVDLHGDDDNSSYDLVSPHFRNKGGKDCLDVLVVTHGDRDHCGGYKKFQEEMDADNLIIGKIIHQGYDRILSDDDDSWSEDYECLQNEINRREDVDNPEFGDLVEAPKAGDLIEDVLEGVDYPGDMLFDVLSPVEGDDEDSEYDVNDVSLVFRLDFDNLEGMLFAGDSSSKYWQEKILPNLEDDSAKSKYLLVAHHGSFTFFGDNRDDVRNADPEPDNYEALDEIEPKELIISANSKFPTNGDSSGDQPPHYAAYKWYHKWFRDNRGVKDKKDEPHPNSWHYTSDVNICIEESNNNWVVDKSWTLEKERSKSAKKLGHQHKKKALIAPELTIQKTRYYADPNI